MSYQIDQACEVRVSGRWVPGKVHEVDSDGTPRVRLESTGRMLRCGPGKVRPVSARVTLRRDPLGGAEGEEELRVIPHAAPAELVEQPKPHTARSSTHLAFVRSRPCAWCGRRTGVEASHHGARGTSIKATDYGAIPLCGGPEGCHTHHTNHHGLPKSTMTHDGKGPRWNGEIRFLPERQWPEVRS